MAFVFYFLHTAFVVALRAHLKIMKVLIIDHSLPIIDRLTEIVEEAERTPVVMKATSYAEAMPIFLMERPGVVLLDMSLPGIEFIRLLLELKKKNPEVVVLVLSIHVNKTIRDECMAMGADYFLDKYHDFTQIPGILQTLYKEKNKIVQYGTR